MFLLAPWRHHYHSDFTAFTGPISEQNKWNFVTRTVKNSKWKHQVQQPSKILTWDYKLHD
jgi:hypothetical protein